MAGKLFIGLMSGTSLDGVDAALVSFDRQQKSQLPQIINTHFLPYSADLRLQILTLQHPTENELETTALISNTLAKLYATAVNELLKISNIAANDICAIGCHGQTIRHRPQFQDGIGFTLQIGNAALLSELTGITVTSDFRSRDIAAGGQGAPLVPAFHQAIFSNNKTSRAIINIGGIANITFLGNTNTYPHAVAGFDSGPGNMLLDAWIKQHLGKDFDANGAWASTGEVINPLLENMLADPYFALPPPKSTGRDLFNDAWLSSHLAAKNHPAQDVARTLVALTSRSIYDALIRNFGNVDEVYLCGGGAHNGLLIKDLQTLLAPTEVSTTDKLGIGVDWLEAIAFAWLAERCLNKQTANLPAVTGAKGARILGAIYQN